MPSQIPKPTTASTTSAATLTATILSAYDLPLSTASSSSNTTSDNNDSANLLLPLYVEMRVCGQTVRTGPPGQRHKHVPSTFKFQSADRLTIHEPSLPNLYRSSVQISVVYPPPSSANVDDNTTTNAQSQPQRRLTAYFSLRQLKIHETQWLVLPLAVEEQENPNATSSSSQNTSTSTSNTTSSLIAASTNTAAASEATSSAPPPPPPPPSVRLQLTVTGPYRTEIAWLVDGSQTWFRTIDATQDWVDRSILPVLRGAVSSSFFFQGWNSQFLALAAAPILVAILVTLPIVVGVVVVTLPLAVPLVVGIGGILAGLACICAVVYCSSRSGRSALLPMVQPMVHTLLSTPAGQGLVYHTGPRPTPVSVSRAFLVPNGIWNRLWLSLVLDGLGSASYLIPGVGEVADILWAPLQTIVVMAMYDDTAQILKYVSFVEEILPFTDIVPTATIGWCLEFGPPLLFPNGIPPILLSTASTTTTSTTTASSDTSTAYQKLRLTTNVKRQQ